MGRNPYRWRRQRWASWAEVEEEVLLLLLLLLRLCPLLLLTQLRWWP